MPYKNDNLEKLFQKAASDYPLRTDNSNWDSISAKLNEPAIDAVASNNKHILKYLALLLFLLGGSLIYYKLQIKNTSADPKAKNINIANQKQSVPKKPATILPEINTQAANNKSNFTLKNFNSIKKIHTLGINYQATNTSNEDVNLNNKIKNIELLNNSSLSSNQNTSLQNIEQPAKLNSLQTLNKNSNAENKQTIAANNQGLNIKTNSFASSKTAQQDIKLAPISSRLYGALYASPEFSMIKSQHINKPGYKIGVALGYRVSNRIDIELGVQREHIHFYTDGKYFDKSGLRLKGTSSLQNVEGSSKLTSVPLSVKYNFIIKPNSHFFTSVGANVVLLTHNENYEYIVSKNGIENDLNRSFGSVTKPKYFTCINTSAGYETKLFNNCSLKIEPYYQMPVSNLGIGKLPVTSFGINIGIVKDLK